MHIAKLNGGGQGEPVPEWDPAPVGSYVFRLMPDNAGSIYVLGNFIQIGGQWREHIAKLSTTGTGSADPIWNPGPDLSVDAIGLDANDQVIVGGMFTFIGGQPRSHIAKLSNTGTGAADANWNPSANGYVYGLTVANGSVYVGGAFTQIGGQLRQSLAKLSAGGNGVADPSWNPSPDHSAELFAVDEDGSVYIGGHFTHIGGQPRSSIAKLSGSGNGAVDPNWNPGMDGKLEGWGNLSIANDALYVIGEFNEIGGQPRQGLCPSLAFPIVIEPDLPLRLRMKRCPASSHPGWR